jgi:hypothetical protein
MLGATVALPLPAAVPPSTETSAPSIRPIAPGGDCRARASAGGKRRSAKKVNAAKE